MIDPSYYEALGLQQYVRPTAAGTAAARSSNPVSDDWLALQEKVKTCTACPLHLSRTHAVFGVGNEAADIMVIGEAPGFNEDQQGEPFVGRAGQLLNEMLSAISLSRSEVYIANIVKCRPPENRNPLVGEVSTCTPYLEQQIMHIKPKLLLGVGRVAAHYLLKTKASLESLRQKVHCYGETNTPLIITYHPAYLLRNLLDKKKAYSDLCFVQEHLKQ